MSAGSLKRSKNSLYEKQIEDNRKAIEKIETVTPDPNGTGLDSSTVSSALHELSSEIKELNTNDFATLYNNLRSK